jgi:T5orf172 domain.
MKISEHNGWTTLCQLLNDWLSACRHQGHSDKKILSFVRFALANFDECQACSEFLRHGFDICRREECLEKVFTIAMSSRLIPDELKRPSPEQPRRPRAPRPPRFIYIYFNPNTELYKIGIANNPSERLKEFQKVDPRIMLLAFWPGSLRDEEELHIRFHKERVRQEWFSMAKDQVQTLIGEHSNATVCGVLSDPFEFKLLGGVA